ncbi:MAG TPA: hypothetical protein IAB37_09180 [Candidatus Faecivivens stercoravium]|uniref:Uncharacterized protein n=1 Tax=Candidatus Faecivivens stercoravium TaxID=2840803 RepID=A0A9D1J5E3_9FIRM|nr:hypothetical protein [Candidatus Faecivivens stercoravium]
MGEDQKFRVQPFKKGWRASKEQSSLAGTHFLYFRSFSQLIRLKRSVRSTQKMLKIVLPAASGKKTPENQKGS